MADVTRIPSGGTKGESARDAEARRRLYESIERAEADIRAGRTHDMNEVLQDLRDRYGI
ncbi:MAG: hypothetical protein ACI38Z_08680 [Parafannyhessea sp.]|jgi:hypothetical protein|uniref:hypothetical protein n=1 Tax=Parafannyhessea sp. TaxID=2847324 RepID=UPI003E7607C8|nr:hypothetical protein [Olsenella sp.]MCI1289424.1 hypothetical protein [Olsenella sp.]